MSSRRKPGNGSGQGGVPARGPASPRRPAAPAAREPSRAGQGASRPAPSLVYKSKESTEDQPDLRLRFDDVGRGFLYAPILGGSLQVPDPCTGQRSTDRLSPRAVRQIKGAAIKAHNLGMGLVTFMTFTVRQEDRQDFIEGELVLGREMKRVLNAFSEWLRRRSMQRLVYVWVAENKSDTNPHVHLLTNYRVPRDEFDGFAGHVEALWGFGWVRIERIRRPERAGRYILKALGYTMKGATEEQGTVIGNRYGIARAIIPTYETHDLYECAEAAEGLRDRQRGMMDEIEELAPGVWLTSYGLSFGAGTDLQGIADVMTELARSST